MEMEKLIILVFFNILEKKIKKKIVFILIHVEFIAATMEKNVYMKSEKLYMAFCMFDIDGSGKISASELE